MKPKEYYEKRTVNYSMSAIREKKLLEVIGNLQNKKVLDVGCATGYFSKKFKEKGNFVVGIDISEKAIKKAEKLLDKAIVVDIEKNGLPLKSNFFDLIIIADVLEHLFSPKEALQKLKKHLKKNGFIVVSVPNFLQWRNRIKMLLGKFNYDFEVGVLDESHLRFFTLESIRKLFEEIGLQEVEMKAVYPTKVTRFSLPHPKFWPSLFANQFVFKLKKK